MPRRNGSIAIGSMPRWTTPFAWQINVSRSPESERRRRADGGALRAGASIGPSLFATPRCASSSAPMRLILMPFAHVETLLDIYVPPSRASALARLSSLEQELTLRSDQVAALVQTLDSPAAVIRRLADSARLEADANKFTGTSSVPSATV
eukprot:6178159-Pleurochrysis_carterae.AAC.3